MGFTVGIFTVPGHGRFVALGLPHYYNIISIEYVTHLMSEVAEICVLFVSVPKGE